MLLTNQWAKLNWFCPHIFPDCVLFMFAFGPAPLTHCRCYYLQYHCRVWGICFHQTLINLVSDYVLHGEISLWDSPHNRVAIYSSMMINSPNKQLPSRLCSDNWGHAAWSSGTQENKTIFLLFFFPPKSGKIQLRLLLLGDRSSVT